MCLCDDFKIMQIYGIRVAARCIYCALLIWHCALAATPLPDEAAAVKQPCDVWLLHMRKSGSTALRAWLAMLAGPTRLYTLQARHDTNYYNDTMALNPACLPLAPRYAAIGGGAQPPSDGQRGVRSVTHMREPLRRVISEVASFSCCVPSPSF